MKALLKHEFLRTRSALGLAALVAVVVAGCGIGAAATHLPLLSTIGMLAIVIIVIGLVPATEIALAVNYRRSAYGRMGYFTQTLPYKGSTIYFAKLIWALVCSLVALIVSIAIALVAFPVLARFAGSASEAASYSYLGTLWHQATAAAPAWAIAAGIAAFVLLNLLWVPVYFFAVAIGNQAPLNRLGVAGPIIVAVIGYLAVQLLALASIVAIPVGIEITGGSIHFLTYNFLGALAAGDGDSPMPLGFIPVFLAIAIAAIAVTKRSTDRKISLT